MSALSLRFKPEPRVRERESLKYNTVFFLFCCSSMECIGDYDTNSLGFNITERQLQGSCWFKFLAPKS